MSDDFKPDNYKKELKLIEFYRRNPVIAAQDLLGVDLAVPQRLILEDMWNKSFVLVTAGRGCGKSFLDSVFAVLWAILFPGQKIGLLAPSFRQAKTLFNEVERRWNESPLIREATEGRPIYASDRCYLKFRSLPYRSGSIIEAVPLGDGNKIRGARYFVIIADEFAQIPEDIFNTVILPMGATVADPMKNVRRIEKQRDLVSKGLASDGDFEEGNSNKVIMTSSAYYQFNHMYRSMKRYQELILAGENKYAVHTVSYKDMPEGFLSEDNITSAKATLSFLQFKMEYEAKWEADSSGVFKASLIEKCKSRANHSVLTKGSEGSRYVLGVDPARVQDASAMCLIELGEPNKLVAAWEYYQTPFPDQAKAIYQICEDFNVVAINLDLGAGGGGSTIRDLLAEEARWGRSQTILDPEHEDTKGQDGRYILHCFKPSPTTNAEAIYATLNLMEQGNLTLPARPQPKGTSPEEFQLLEAQEDIYEVVDKLVQQIMLIEVTENRSGTAHFDVPSGDAHKKQKKDLFTSFILASKKVYDLNIGTDNKNDQICLFGIIENKPDYVPLPQRPSLNTVTMDPGFSGVFLPKKKFL